MLFTLKRPLKSHRIYKLDECSKSKEREKWIKLKKKLDVLSKIMRITSVTYQKLTATAFLAERRNSIWGKNISSGTASIIYLRRIYAFVAFSCHLYFPSCDSSASS